MKGSVTWKSTFIPGTKMGVYDTRFVWRYTHSQAFYVGKYMAFGTRSHDIKSHPGYIHYSDYKDSWKVVSQTLDSLEFLKTKLA